MMKKNFIGLLAGILCGINCLTYAWNQAMYESDRWVYFDTNDEANLEYDKNSISFEDDRYIYVWVRSEFIKPSLQGKSGLQLLCIDTKKKKANTLDYVAYKDRKITSSMAKYNTYSTEYCIPTDKKYIEDKVNKYLLETLYDKKEKMLLVDTDTKQAHIPENHSDKWSYVSDLSTNIWKYIGGRDLSHNGSAVRKDDYVFYYDKQTLKLSDDGRYVSVWLKYRFVEEVGSYDEPKKAKYGLTRTTLDIQEGTYADHVALSFNDDGTLDEVFTSDLNVANPILAGTVMDIIWKALIKDLTE